MEKRSGCRTCLFACVVALVSLALHGWSRVLHDEDPRQFVRRLLNEQLNDALHGQDVRQLVQRLIDEELMIRKLPLKRARRDAMLQKSSVAEENTVSPHVEFFNPKMRGELEVKDELEQRRSGQPGPAPGGDTWVWLTSYSRVPYKVVQGFCKATQDYCPPGVQGPKGPAGAPGPKGDKGSSGTPGLAGAGGPPGPVGPPGPKGSAGLPGLAGLDGRDGVPGEPGLDGLPGRHGLDGAAGKDGRDGVPGKHGTPGKDGNDGKDGKPGLTGPPGLRGVKGPPGPPGPKGAKGSDGKDGTPGRPGITTWKYNNGSDFLVPPSFPRDISHHVVEEGQHVRLPCLSSGKPEPTLEWRRLDGSPILQGAWRDLAVAGTTLTITSVSRRHSGQYICLANNGVPPAANQTFHLQVQFSPFIRVANNVVYTVNKTARLECEVQAFPEPVVAWEAEDGREPEGPRFKSELVPTPLTWRWVLRLEISNVVEADLTDYFCVAKNELRNQTTKGRIRLEKGDGSRKHAPQGVLEWGESAPPLSSYEELCHVQRCPACPGCDRSQLVITPLLNYTTYRQRRNTNCQLYAIGKPVFHSEKQETYGSWMRDTKPADGVPAERMWVTSEADANHLVQFESKSDFKNNRNGKVITLTRPIFGNGHIVYNGSFFYQQNVTGRPGDLVRHDLTGARVETRTVPGAGGFLYSWGRNQIDFSADDNGLWAIYSIKDSKNTAVAKIYFDPKKLDGQGFRIESVWNITLNHREMGEMFVVCGVLYALDSTTERDTKVSVAVDLFTNRRLDLTLPFTNPFRLTTLLSYDHRHKVGQMGEMFVVCGVLYALDSTTERDTKELYSWDKGNLLTYPVRYNEVPEL